MGTWGVAGDGNSADRSTWIVFRNSATRIRIRLSAGGNCVLDRVSVLRLARPLRRGRASGVPCVLHPDARAGIAGLVAPAARDGGFLERRSDCYKTPLGAFSLRHFVNDGVQRDVARDPKHVSNFSRRTTPLWSYAKGGDRDDLCFRCNLRWNGGRLSLAKMGTPSFDNFDCCAWSHPDSFVGFFARFRPFGDRRIRHAIHGARRL